jgi:hypothetical protein
VQRDTSERVRDAYPIAPAGPGGRVLQLGPATSPRSVRCW